MKNKLIFVSHSGKQYVHQLLYGLQTYSLPFIFFTSFWYKPSQAPFTWLNILPEAIRNKVVSQFKKRSYDKLQDAHIRTFPWFEFVREIADKIFSHSTSEYFLYWRDRIHDRWAASQLNANYSAVIGYEECSLLTFRKAKKLGITTILDLAQIHFKEIEIISNQFPVFSEIYANKKLRTRINTIKAEELALADNILCLSSFAKESLIKHGINPDKIKVVNLGFDPEKFTPKSTYSNLSNEPLKIVYAGTITKRKGIDQLLRLVDDFPNQIKITVIGSISDAGDIFEKYKPLITWYPYLEQQEMNKVFNENDLFVFPSYLDSWAMVVVEAMACGLPVIVTENTGAKDAVTSDIGEILPAGDYEKLKETLLHISQHKDYLSRKGKSARAQSELYTWQNYHLQIANFFKSDLQNITY